MSFLRRLLAFTALWFTLAPALAFAQAPGIDCGQPGVLIGCNQATAPIVKPNSSVFGDLIGNVVNTTLSIFALIAVIFVVKGGITLITSLGNDEKMKKAKNTILYALAGLFVSTLAYLIVNIVTRIQLF